MTEIIQKLDIQIMIGDLPQLDSIIKQRLDSILNKCYNSIIITEILDYHYEQKFININSLNCDLSFRIVFRCKYKRYYEGDILCLMVCGEKESSFDLSNNHCRGYMLKDLNNRILRPSNHVLARVFEPIYSQNDQFVCRLELYTPNPVIYKVKLTSHGSELFEKLKVEINELITKASALDELSQKISVNIGKDPISLDNLPTTFYMHLNNGNTLGLYNNVKSNSGIKPLLLSSDVDYVFLMMIKNYLETIIDYAKVVIYDTPLFQYYERVIMSNTI